MSRYTRTPGIVEATQWKSYNWPEVFEWLEAHDIQFSYDELASGGELIVYMPSPLMVPVDSYIVVGDVVDGKFICASDYFEAHYTELSEVESDHSA